MANDNGTRYLRSADFLKGFAIIVIVILHSFSGLAPEDPSEIPITELYNPILDIFYSALMMFFLLSGYFYKPENGRWKNIKKRIIQIVPIFIICGTLLTLIMVGWGNIFGFTSSMDDIVKDLVNTLTMFSFQQPWIYGSEYGYVCIGWYFVMNILSALIIFYLIADRCLKSWKHVAVSVAICLAIQIPIAQFFTVAYPLRLDLAPMAVAFMIVGAFMRKHDVILYLENNFKTKKFWMILIPVITAGFVISFFLPSGCCYSFCKFGLHGGFSVISFFVIMLCCGYFLLCISAIACHLKHSTKLFSFFSRYSLHILILHGFFLKLLQTPFYGMSKISLLAYMPIPSTVVIGLSSLILSLLTAYIGSKVYYRLKDKISASHRKEDLNSHM